MTARLSTDHGKQALLYKHLSRLVFDGLAAVLLLLCLAYWWLGNLTHELFGTALFALLIRHNIQNRRWYAMLGKGPRNAPRTVATILNLALAAVMLFLLITSLAISRSVFAFLPIPDNFTMRELHWFIAYWVLVIVGMHLGLHWERVMTITRNALNLRPSQWRVRALRLLALVLSAWGVYAVSLMDLGTKLTFGYSLSMWDFNNDALMFFLHWFAIIALIATATHFALKLPRTRRAT